MLRAFSASPTGKQLPEEKMKAILLEKLSADVVQVRDVSGGCGDFYQILVVSPLFEGQLTVKQHRAVNEALEKEIGKMHGLTIKTMSSSKWKETQAAEAAASSSGSKPAV
jgi:stress-induced morphogen